MNEYGIIDYAIFDNADATTRTATTEVNSCSETIEAVKKVLSDDSVFMGDTARSCIAAFSDANRGFSSITKNFASVSRYLNKTSSTYKHADTSASKTVSEVGTTNTSKGTARSV